MIHESSIQDLKAFQRKKWTCSKIPFSGNLDNIDLVQAKGLERLEDFPKHMPNWIMSTTLLKGSPFYSRPNHTKGALYSTRGWGKESKYFTSFRSVYLEFV